MEKALLVAAIRNRIFNDQQTDVKAALSAAHAVIDTIGDPASRIGALTAMHVVLNTVANAIEALPEFLPAPPDEVRISPVDNPAAGASDIEAAIIRMIDSRIAQSPAITSVMTACLDESTSHFATMITAAEKRTADRIEEINVLVEGKVTEGIDDFIANQLDDEIQKYMDNSVDFTEIVRDELKQNITFNVEVE
jgi:hypothetical protein